MKRRGDLAARRRGNALRDARRWTEAAAEYRRWLAGNPEDAAIWIQLGHMLGEAGDFARAEAAYQEAARLAPDDADLALCRGHLARRAGDPEAALAFYRQSLALDGNADAANALALLAPPEPEPAPEPEHDPPAEPEAPEEPAPAPLPHGAVEAWYHRSLSGTVHDVGEGPAHIEISRDGIVIGRAALSPPGPDGGRAFRAIADYPGGMAQVVVRLMPAGVELANSPVLLVAPEPAGEGPPPAWAVDAFVAKTIPAAASAGEVALFVTHSPAGMVKPHVLPYVAALEQAGVAVLLIVVADRPVELPPALIERASGVMVRANAGWDFAAWAHALHLHPELYGARRLYLANDSLFGPSDPAALAAIVARIRGEDADLAGLTASHEWRWHLQSYFLAIGPRLLSSFVLHDFMRGVRLLDDKDAVIQAYEARLTALVEGQGYRATALFESMAAINPTLFDWRGLVERGFPFVKILLLRGAFPEADIAGWRETLAAAGFDLALLDKVLLPGPAAVPDIGDRGLLVARPLALPEPEERPLRIAFFGPWNHDGALGAASRDLIAALRRTGARVSLSPVRAPSPFHPPLGPAADIAAFDGPADIALVQVDPDRWHLLDERQVAAIRGARRRIGYWACGMETLPPAWQADIQSVDHIWAPTRWCADLFARETNAPVELVPPLPPRRSPAGADGRALLTGMGVPEGARTILQILDGPDCLVRGNPAALVRAFAASGLAGRGWRLVLQTRPLADPTDGGMALAALAGETEGVHMVDRGMTPDALAALVAACDIYASPHCAEGWGLRVAEAMAAGRAVVATDYSGTRDVLDCETGWPVRAHGWTLAEDHGPHEAGTRWARIDEPALAHALTQAAAAVEAGDRTRQEAAAARIATRPSPDTAAERMMASFRATLAGPPRAHPQPRVSGNVPLGIPLAEADFGPEIRVAAFPGPIPEGGEPWLALFPAGALVSPVLESALARAVAARPDAALFTGDDFARDDQAQLRLFPEFDPVLLASRGYADAAVLVRRAALAALGGADGVDALLLKAHEAGLPIGRIPEVVMARLDARPMADVAARKALIAAHWPHYRVTEGRAPGLLELARPFADEAPSVTLLIPTRRSLIPEANRSYVDRLLDALEETDWPMDRLHVIVGDDVEGMPDWDRARPYGFRRIETPRPKGALFNYAAKMNALWRAAETEQIVFLNDDLLPADPAWLKALQTFALDRAVGGVGARLDYEDGRVQHAGVGPLFGRVGHVWAGRSRIEGTYQDWALAQRQWSMVTGAVFATRRAALEEVNGFDERFTLEFNDIDLCLRLRAAGYRIVYTPAARLAHAEKASRGEALPRGDEIAAFLSRWKGWLAADPAWHPLLDPDALEATPRHAGAAWYF